MVPTNRCGRRRFLATAGASVAAFTGAVPGFAAQTPAESAGRLVFIYDDSPEEDYTETFPVHREAGVPACIAAVSGAIGTEGSLSADILREVESAGWGIMSHTVDHRAIGTLSVTADVEPDDTKVYTHSNRHGEHPGDRVRVFDGETHAVATVAGQGSDGTGEYVALEEAIGTPFDADAAKIRYTDERIRTSLRGSRRQLEDYGVAVSNLVLPYGVYGERARELVPSFYDAVANAKWDGDGLNDVRSLDPYRLHRVYFRPGQMTLEELEAYLDDVVERDVLGLLGGHSAYEQFTAERVRTAIRMAGDRNIEILTLREALADLGVVEPTATPPQSTATTREATTARRTTSGGTTHPTATRRTTDPGGTETSPAGGETATAQTPTATDATGPGFGVLAALSGLGLLASRRDTDT